MNDSDPTWVAFIFPVAQIGRGNRWRFNKMMNMLQLMCSCVERSSLQSYFCFWPSRWLSTSPPIVALTPLFHFQQKLRFLTASYMRPLKETCACSCPTTSVTDQQTIVQLAESPNSKVSCTKSDTCTMHRRVSLANLHCKPSKHFRPCTEYLRRASLAPLQEPNCSKLRVGLGDQLTLAASIHT